MDKVQVKSESPPTRCEICHQADLFDRATNQCLRCNKLNTFSNQPIQSKEVIEKIDNFLKRMAYLVIKVVISGFLAGISARLVFEIGFNSPLSLTKQEFNELLRTICFFGLAGICIGSCAALQIILVFRIKNVKYNLIYGTVLGLFFGYFMGITGCGMPSPSLCFMDKSQADYIYLCTLLFDMFVSLIIGIIICIRSKY